MGGWHPESLTNTMDSAIRSALGDRGEHVTFSGRLTDGRRSYTSTTKSHCEACSVIFLRPYQEVMRDRPCEKRFRKQCRHFLLAKMIERFSSAEEIERAIETELHKRKIEAEVKLGGPGSYDLGISIWISEKQRSEFEHERLQNRRLKKLANTISEINSIIDQT